jgi:hypothetical protein
MNFGYTVLGFGSGGKTPIPEDLIAAEADCEATTQINVQTEWRFDIDPFNENKILAAYRDDGTYGNDVQCVCGTISADGTTVTWGSIVEIWNTYGGPAGVSFDPNTENSFCITFQGRDGSNNTQPMAVAGTLSGTTITLGTPVDTSWCTSDDQMNHHSGLFNPNQSGQVCVISGNYNGASCSGGAHRQLEFKVLTISGTTVTHVSSQVVDTATSGQGKLVWDPVTSNKGYIFSSLNSDYPYVIPFTMSGNTPTFGTKQVTNSYTSYETHMGCVMEQGGRIVHMYRDANDLRVKVGNDSATDESGTITWGTEVTVADYDDEGSHLILYATCQSDSWSGQTPNKVLMGYNIPVSGECSRWMIGTITGDDTISIGSYENAFSHTGTPDINQPDPTADPHNPGRIYTGHSYTGNSSATMLVRHQLPSYEL